MLRSISILLLWLTCFALPSFAQDVMPKTVITSESLEMQGTEDRNYFYFRKDVRVEGNNLRILCDSLTVVARRQGTADEAVGEIGPIEEIVAIGGVEIHQAGRSAYAGKAEVDPASGTVVLSDNPKIVDDEVEVEGYQFVLNKGEKKFISVPDPNAPAGKPSRSTVRLGGLPDMGFDQDKVSLEEEKASEEEKSEAPNSEEANPETGVSPGE